MGAETSGVLLLPHSSTTSCCHNRLHDATSWSSCTVDVVWLLRCSRFHQIDADRSCSTVGGYTAALWRWCGMLLLACCYFCASLLLLAMKFLTYILIFTFFLAAIFPPTRWQQHAMPTFMQHHMPAPRLQLLPTLLVWCVVCCEAYSAGVACRGVAWVAWLHCSWFVAGNDIWHRFHVTRLGCTYASFWWSSSVSARSSNRSP